MSKDATSRRKRKAGGEPRPETLSDEAVQDVTGSGAAPGRISSGKSADSILFFDEADALLAKSTEKKG